ncbi:tetratricopeptide repeat protein [Falsiroseomonas tokyonensis]|uniref:Tetratricopeptide repeat protein n=1 Tax=Falsiroseomonas tokyonensis TaxID=430521 RepID=A0ABV7BP18_9PROT|nr:tetratricopeptide repeat protein [Falsiroseomonas tokyonensis]MBU8537358.1 tetratricopeptide repeat protein [Falsiroseomonas tokyonensis]
MAGFRGWPGLLLLAGLAGCAGAASPGADVSARLRVAAVAEASGQSEIAVSVLSSLAASAPDNTEVQARFARSLIQAGNLAEAEAVLMRTLRARPGDARALRELGRMRLLEGRAAEALDAFRTVLAAAPRDVPSLVGSGVALDLLGREEAKASYAAALALEPGNLAAANNLALSLLLADRPAEAVALLGPLARRHDAPERVRNNLAVAEAATAGASGVALRGSSGSTSLR